MGKPAIHADSRSDRPSFFDRGFIYPRDRIWATGSTGEEAKAHVHAWRRLTEASDSHCKIVLVDVELHRAELGDDALPRVLEGEGGPRRMGCLDAGTESPAMFAFGDL